MLSLRFKFEIGRSACYVYDSILMILKIIRLLNNNLQLARLYLRLKQ
jgi:hypothetical protein